MTTFKRPRLRFRMLKALACLMSSLIGSSAFAGQAPGTHLIEVGGEPITRAALDHLATDTKFFAENTPESRADALEALVDRALLARAGRDLNPSHYDSVATAAEYRALWRQLCDSFHTTPTPEALAEYRERRVDYVVLRQIVTETRADAEAVLERLKAGEEFAELAREVSIDVAGSHIGGEVRPPVRYGDWYPELNDLITTINEGDVVGPILTWMGWHVITCDRLESREESPDVITDAALTKNIHLFEEHVGTTQWEKESQVALGARVHEEGIDEALENILPGRFWKMGWVPSDAPIASTASGFELSVAEFARNFQVFEWLTPQARNPVSFRSTALRLLYLKRMREQFREGSIELAPRYRAALFAERDRSTAMHYLEALNAEIDVDLDEAERVYETNDEPFMATESLAVAVLFTHELDIADEMYAKLSSGDLTLAEAVAEVKTRDPASYFLPRMPFYRGRFPEVEPLFSMEEGEFVEPFPIADGYSVYQIVEKRPPRKFLRSEIADEELRERVLQHFRSNAKASALEELRRTVPITRHEAEVRLAIDAG